MVVGGPEDRREIHVPAAGFRIGRASRNDLCIADDAMSRFQCRFFFKPGEGLWVSDLGSANGTLVNGKLAHEQRLKRNDEVLAGDTLLRVMNEGEDSPAPVQPEAPAPRAAAPETPVAVSPAPPAVSPVTPAVNAAPPAVSLEPLLDLGLKKGAAPTEAVAGAAMRKKLIWAAGVMAIVVIAAWLPWDKLVGVLQGTKQPVVAAPRELLPELDVALERVEGSASNIFRYALEIKDNILVVQVDDLATSRHVRREKKVAAELLKDLARSLESAGFFRLRDEYAGLAPGIHDASDLSVSVGTRTRRVKVVNHIEPEEFAAARSIIEEFGKNELGLAALAIDPASLVIKARDALLQGKKMWDEREVRDGNLFRAIRAYTECAWYLETIEPKPDFYAEAVGAKSDCERELQRRYNDLLFMAEKAVKLRDWKEAERHLKVICEMIPDPSDDRYRNADIKLVDVGRHISVEK
jgi:hypothetical protein